MPLPAVAGLPTPMKGSFNKDGRWKRYLYQLWPHAGGKASFSSLPGWVARRRARTPSLVIAPLQTVGSAPANATPWHTTCGVSRGARPVSFHRDRCPEDSRARGPRTAAGHPGQPRAAEHGGGRAPGHRYARTNTNRDDPRILRTDQGSPASRASCFPHHCAPPDNEGSHSARKPDLSR